MKTIIQFKNLIDIDKQLKDDSTCRDYYEGIRWDGLPTCPHCGCEDSYILKRTKQNNYKCKNKDCGKKYNCLTGTIFENTKISLIVWFKAIHLQTSLSKGISSINLAQVLGVTQKTAWFLEHRIREMLNVNAPSLSGIVEADETYIGGKEGNKHKSKRSGNQGPNPAHAPVVGVVERGGNIILKTVKKVTVKSVIPSMVKNVTKGSTVYTDEWSGYRRLKKTHIHDAVKHRAEEYVRGAVHTGTIDGAWNLFKKRINGIHHQVSKKHLHRYCNEFSFSYNNRKTPGYDKFNLALNNCVNRLKYQVLIGKQK